MVAAWCQRAPAAQSIASAMATSLTRSKHWGLAKRFRLALVGSHSYRVFHFMRIGGKNGLPSPILIDLFHHRDHRQEHQQNYDDRHNLLPLQK
jgi:hypothetical protein